MCRRACPYIFSDIRSLLGHYQKNYAMASNKNNIQSIHYTRIQTHTVYMNTYTYTYRCAYLQNYAIIQRLSPRVSTRIRQNSITALFGDLALNTISQPLESHTHSGDPFSRRHIVISGAVHTPSNGTILCNSNKCSRKSISSRQQHQEPFIIASVVACVSQSVIVIVIIIAVVVWPNKTHLAKVTTDYLHIRDEYNASATA